eukprot:TRINITY_DN11851_c0_g1_i1.p1 TRINITY_DN11851_c0_g1~~TRINITY_DN11851_c0_g1_i1.p1  ORF type:complete len:117 (-),score=11.12 TRINITY_DN11851_c0_g1_i1:119-469(-)
MFASGDIMLLIINPLSILFCLVVIISYLMFKQLRKYPSFLFFNIFIVDFFASFLKFLRPVFGGQTLFQEQNRKSCLASGFFLEVFTIVECFMDLAISINLFITIYWYAHRKTSSLP